MNPLKILFISLGFLLFGLAAIGVFVPVLPTTPLLLLAAFFFARGSDRFNKWFLSTKLYQDYAESFVKHRAMTRKVKITICLFATILLLVALVLVPMMWAKVVIALIIAIKYYYFVFCIKTISPEEDAAIKAADKAEREARTQTSTSLKETLGEVRELHEDAFKEAKNSLMQSPANEDAEN